MIAICCPYYRSLTLANLSAALFSLRQQTFTHVAEVVVLDNNTDDPVEAIEAVVDALAFPVPVRLLSVKHGDVTKTHAWSTNTAVRATSAAWVLFMRADYLLAFDAVDRLVAATSDPAFIVGGYYDLDADIQACEQTQWRQQGPAVLHPLGREYFHTAIDAGVWCTTRTIFETVGGLDESLTAWGHAQTHFQYKLHRAGIPTRRLSEILFYHPTHAYVAPRDHVIARTELERVGVTLGECWARYDGPDHPYRGVA